LRDVDMMIRGRGIRAVMGPGGAGKSTLLRALAGPTDQNTTLETSGVVLFQGAPLDGTTLGPRPFLVEQRLTLTLKTGWELIRDALPARSTMLVSEQLDHVRIALRKLGLADFEPALDQSVVELDRADRAAIAAIRAYVSNAPLVLFDEPTAELDDAASARTLGILKKIAEKRSVVWVTHRLDLVRTHASRVTLLVTGRVVIHASTREFFASTDPVVADYVRTGSCVLPDDATPRWALAPLARRRLSARLERAAPDGATRGAGPSGFRWLVEGRLAGTAQPGLVAEIAHDLEALAVAGVSTLITLTEAPIAEGSAFDMFGLSSLFFPIPDGNAPEVGAAVELLATIEALFAEGECVAFHCKAGKGRTGVMLAACLVYEGRTPSEAIRQVRAVDRGWIQTAAQEEFVYELAAALHRERTAIRSEIAASS
jgi:atypical dual specificity phosphatase